MPTNAELLQLQNIVLNSYPMAPDFSGRAGDERARQYLRAFCSAFRALGVMRRTEAPDRLTVAEAGGGIIDDKNCGSH